MEPTHTPHRGVKLCRLEGRERYLSEEEYARLVPVLEAHPHKIAAGIIRLTLLTGCRFTEAREALWEHFDLTSDKPGWRKPASTLKQAKTHHCSLTQESAALLLEIKSFVEEHSVGSPYVFPCLRTSAHRHARNGGGLHDVETKDQVRKVWAEVCKLAGIDGVRIHDLRHSFASVLVSNGVSLPMIGALLGHSNIATTSRYAHLYDSALRDAAGMVSRVVSSARLQAAKEIDPCKQ